MMTMAGRVLKEVLKFASLYLTSVLVNGNECAFVAALQGPPQ